MATGTDRGQPLSTNERWAAGAAGAILVIVGCCLGKRETVGETLVLAGVVFVLLAFSGLRYTKLTAGKFAIETPAPAVQSAQSESTAIGAVAAVLDQEPDALTPEPEAASRGSVTIQGREWPVYELDAVPLKVIAQPFADWKPEYGVFPKSSSQFEFAVRLGIGKGNHPWVIKFKDTKCLKVTAGGQGKIGMTVTALDG